jgi:rhodanese-related sulfurtransferase
MIRQMTVNELKERLDKESGKLILLDVREPWEWGVCRIPGSITLSLGEIPARAEEVSRDAEIVVLCHHGIRSRRASLYLERAGFTNLNNLVGGIDAWAREVDPKMPTY